MARADISSAQLRGIKCLAHLSEPELTTFVGYTEEVSVPANTVLFEEGQPGDCMFLLMTGEVRVLKNQKNGGTETVNVLGPGEAFGDIALFHETGRTATVETTKDCRLLRITAAALRELASSQPDLSDQFLFHLTRSLSQMYRNYR